MGKGELKKYVSEKTGITPQEAGIVIDVVMNGLVESIIKGEKTTMPNFGKFEVKTTAPRQARNPKTGEPVFVEARKVVRFKAARSLKEKVNS
jgi:nucleoid DNA-binding protein